MDKADLTKFVEALRESKQLIRSWHGMGAPAEVEKRMWAIYENHSPEMKRLNEAIQIGEKLLDELS